MSKHEPNRIDLSDKNEQNDAGNKPLGRGTELEKRFTPLVVIAIIAVLISLLLPAVQSVR